MDASIELFETLLNDPQSTQNSLDELVNRILKSRSDNFDFEILINLSEINMTTTKCQIIFNGNFSTMIEMMAKKPLENFLNNITRNIEGLELSN